MGSFQFQKRKGIGGGRAVNVSKGGVSVSQRMGPLSVSSRGRGSLRILPGFSYRFGGKGNGWIGLVIGLVFFATYALAWVLIAAVRVMWFLTFGFIVWLARMVSSRRQATG